MEFTQDNINLLSTFILNTPELKTCAVQEDWEKLFRGIYRNSNIKDRDIKICVDSFSFLYHYFMLLDNISILEFVATIPNLAFYEDDILESIVIPKSINTIRPGAFCNCDNLKYVKIENGLRNMYYEVFAGCINLERIEFEAVQHLISIDNYTFDHCHSLKHIDLPASVTAIGDNAFDGCSALDAVEIPEHVQIIGDFAFQGCNNLKYVKLPKDIVRINTFAFNDCDNLTDIYYAGTLQDWFKVILSTTTFGNLKSQITLHCSDAVRSLE